jgi:hypothetical protein
MSSRRLSDLNPIFAGPVSLAIVGVNVFGVRLIEEGALIGLMLMTKSEASPPALGEPFCMDKFVAEMSTSPRPSHILQSLVSVLWCSLLSSLSEYLVPVGRNFRCRSSSPVAFLAPLISRDTFYDNKG